MENQEWSEPELIVLVRAKPEEMVLEGCKRYSTKDNGPYLMLLISGAPTS
jgi:hypothetical protein